MNLYKISQNENSDYDTYDSAVVCAPNENTARSMYPGDGTLIGDETKWVWVDDPKFVTVLFLGEAAPGIECGVVCASFNAG